MGTRAMLSYCHYFGIRLEAMLDNMHSEERLPSDEWVEAAFEVWSATSPLCVYPPPPMPTPAKLFALEIVGWL